MKEKAIIVDFDGTLCDAKARRHYLEGSAPNFDKFYMAAAFCSPHKWCVDIVNRYAESHAVIIVTGQPEQFHDYIKMWLEKHDLAYAKILGRATADFRKDAIVKEDIYKCVIEPHYDVLFCIDDRKQVVDMWRSLGLVCLQCDEGNF